MNEMLGMPNPESLIGMFGLAEGMSVADFGSGSGHLGILAAQKVGKDGKVYAFDIMESALEAINGRASALGLANIEARRTNLEVAGSTGLADGSVDVVFMANILFQNPDKELILKEAQRILKGGCRLIVIEWLKGAAGLGPPDEYRTDQTVMASTITGLGFSVLSNQVVGKYHYLLISAKS